jgi:tight adherence protein B
MITTELLIIFAGVAGMAMLLIFVGLRLIAPADAQVSSRLDAYLSNDLARLPDVDLDPEAPGSAVARRLNDAITRRRFAQELSRELDQANLPLTVPEWVLLRIAIPLVLALLTLLIWRAVLLVPIALFVGFIAPVLWITMLRNKRHQLFNDQLAETLQMLCSALRGGFSLAQALKMVAKESPEPTRKELERVVQETQLGLGLNTALDNLVARIESADLDLVVTAIKINGRVGGNLTEVLESISTTIRERGKLRREVKVITSMQRMSAYVIGVLPFALAGIIFAINPEYMARLFEPGPILCLPIGAFSSAVIGFFIIRRIADIKV